MSRSVALYCRLSPRPDGLYEGVDLQERWGRAYAAKVWPDLPVEVFAERGITAARDDVTRPAYERMRQAIAAGKVAQVWAVEQYRVERREIAWFVFAAELEAAGITELHTDRDGVVRVRDEVAGIKAVLGAGEVRRIKRRINDKLDANAADGKPSGSRPFGYVHAVNDAGVKTYAVVPEQAESIVWAAERVLDGWSLANISKQLADKGVRGAHGGTITPNAVRRMVTNATVAGKRVHRGVVVGDGNWPAILPEVTWQAVRSRLTGARRVLRADGKGDHPVGDWAGRRSARKYALTGGLAVCGVCGARLLGSTRRWRVSSEPVAYMQCHPKVGGRGCVTILLEPTEAEVARRLFAELDKPEFLELLGVDDVGERRDEIVRKLDALDRRRSELAELWADPGGLTTTEWQAARDRLDARERELRDELAAIPTGVERVDVAGAREAWEDMTLDERREFLRLFIERVTVNSARARGGRFDPDRIVIEWRTS